MKLSPSASRHIINSTRSNMKTSQTSLNRSDSSARSQAVPRLRVCFAFTVLAVLTLLGLAPRAAAQGRVPERMTFQGFMEDANGVPLGQSAPVNLPVVFRIYPSATGGVSSWAEKQTVTFDMGRYSVLLGSGAAEGNEPHGKFSELLQTNPGAQLYVETEVTINGTPATITPRLRLVASPYAMLATRALSAESAESADSAATLTGTLPVQQLSGSLLASQLGINSVTEEKIANGAVTDAKILNGAVVAAKIANGAVYGAKIANGGINESHISPGAVTEAKIANGAVSSAKIESLDANKLFGTLSAARLPAAAARRDVANTFTANQTMNANLTVNGSLNLGTYKATVGSETLRIVRGTVRLNGSFQPTASSGTGYTVTSLNNSTSFRITFEPAFSGEPAVTITPIKNTTFGGDGTDSYPRITELNASSVDINFIFPSNYSGSKMPFSFIAVGPL